MCNHKNTFAVSKNSKKRPFLVGVTELLLFDCSPSSEFVFSSSCLVFSGLTSSCWSVSCRVMVTGGVEMGWGVVIGGTSVGTVVGMVFEGNADLTRPIIKRA